MKTDYSTIELEVKQDTGYLRLNRPAIRNAFNETMIAEIISGIRELSGNPGVKVILLTGNGKVFCAGADLNWMKDVAGYTYDQNYRESYQLSECFYTLYTCPKPTIAVVHGAAIGGANGLLAACDMAYADEDTVFSLSEVKIGIVPACISPYVIKRVGEYGARELMLTGKRFNGREAEHYRLVNRSLKGEETWKHVEEVIGLLRTSGPRAMTHCKALIRQVSNNWTLKQALAETARMIAEIRSSEEGQEGMKAFLEKRPPSWIDN